VGLFHIIFSDSRNLRFLRRRFNYRTPASPVVFKPSAFCKQARSNLIRSDLPSWRKGWDSNPRYRCRHDGFQDRFLKPLGHPSIFCGCNRGDYIRTSLQEQSYCFWAKTTASTCFAPWVLRSSAADSKVAPVVVMSSTSNTLLPLTL
jgi:hypothetical protein